MKHFLLACALASLAQADLIHVDCGLPPAAGNTCASDQGSSEVWALPNGFGGSVYAWGVSSSPDLAFTVTAEFSLDQMIFVPGAGFTTLRFDYAFSTDGGMAGTTLVTLGSQVYSVPLSPNTIPGYGGTEQGMLEFTVERGIQHTLNVFLSATHEVYFASVGERVAHSFSMVRSPVEDPVTTPEPSTFALSAGVLLLIKLCAVPARRRTGVHLHPAREIGHA